MSLFAFHLLMQWCLFLDNSLDLGKSDRVIFGRSTGAKKIIFCALHVPQNECQYGRPLHQHWVKAVHCTLYWPRSVFFGAIFTCTCLVFVLLHADWLVVCCHMQVWANHANDKNRHVHLAFPTYSVVSSNVTSCGAQNFEDNRTVGQRVKRLP